MSDEGKIMLPEHLFKKMIWRSTLTAGEALERSTTWTIGGTAAIAALVVSNLDSVAKIASLNGVKTAIVLLSLSLLAGAISKQVGMAVAAGVKTLEQTESLLSSVAGQKLMHDMTIAPNELIRELADPFFWPLSTLMRKSGERGLLDYLAADKRFVKLFCLQIAFNTLHGLSALAALLSIGLAI